MVTPSFHLGIPFTRHEGRVDPDAAIAYALATNDPNDAYLRGDAVPPLFSVSLIHPAFGEAIRRGTDEGAIRGATGAVHAQHDVHIVGRLQPGMAVTWRAQTYCARQSTAGALVTQRIDVLDADGQLLVAHYWSTLHTGGHIEAPVGPDLPDHAFPPSARDRPLATRIVGVSVDQAFRYAGASGDRNPHCVDDEAARREGLPSKILQGLCTLGLCTAAVVEVGAQGDPDRVRRIAGRFSAPAFPRHPLTVDVFDAGHTPDGARVLAFEAAASGVTVLKHGRAEIRMD